MKDGPERNMRSLKIKYGTIGRLKPNDETSSSTETLSDKISSMDSDSSGRCDDIADE